jgi:hypothetical protein
MAGCRLAWVTQHRLRDLVSEVPPPLVAEMLGYSYQVTQRPAELAGTNWAKYAT